MKYKLLVLDVDGTLLNNEKKITKGTLAALLKVQQMGLPIVLASGRPLAGLLPIAEQLELSRYGGYIMAYNGSLVINANTNETIFEKTIDAEFIPFLNKKAKKNEVSIFTYKNDNIITENPDNPYIKAEAVINNIQITQVADFDEAVNFNPYKCVMVDDDYMTLEKLGGNLRKRLDGSLDVFISEDFFLEILPQNVNKGNTLAMLKDMLGIKQEELIAIGNGNGDIPMLHLAGVGISMGNSSDNVKRCSDDITLSNEEDGVAAALEKYVLKEIRSAIPLEQLNEHAKHALMGNLGIQYTYVSESRVEATMPVDERTRQPFGILHGGASLALAETVAGLGSLIIAKPDEIVVGMQVSGNHISSAQEGDTVRAVATIIHQGRSSHVWDVNIYTSTDKLISVVRVCNSVLKKK
jgi:Cof subfamily protein (haloacid dehalogenase superfamily)